MLSKEAIQKAALALYQAEVERKQIEPIRLSHPDMGLDDAYAIQSHWVNRKISEGRKVIGYKIGLTSKSMQKAMNIDEPDYGVLLDDMLFDAGAQIRAADFLDPRIEAEIAFVLKRELRGRVSIFDVLNATDYVVPALELIAARSYRVHPETGYTRTLLDTIADNAANAGVILGGRPMRPDDLDLRWCGALLYVNETIEQTGLAAAVLNHPANGVSWLAKCLGAHAVVLKPGQIILSGSFTAPVTIKAGDSIYADYGQLGSIAVKFV